MRLCEFCTEAADRLQHISCLLAVKNMVHLLAQPATDHFNAVTEIYLFMHLKVKLQPTAVLLLSMIKTSVTISISDLRCAGSPTA